MWEFESGRSRIHTGQVSDSKDAILKDGATKGSKGAPVALTRPNGSGMALGI